MRVQWLTLCAAALALIAGCSKKTTEPKIHTVNSYSPNSNGRILSQSTFGSSVGHSMVSELTSDGSSGLYFRGSDNDLNGVGQLGATGELVRFANAGFTPRKVLTLSASAAVPNGLVAVGGEDTDKDGASEVGHVGLYTSSGTASSHLEYASDSSDVWLNCIAPVSDSLFVVAGGERTPRRTNPFIATIALTPSGELQKRQSLVVTDIANRVCDELAVNPAEPVGPTLGIYVATFADPEGGVRQTPVVHRITLAFPDLTPCTVEWSRQISSTSARAWAEDLCLYGDHLYLAGYAEDPANKAPTSDGRQWHSGMAASLTLAGDLLWTKVLTVTGDTEELYQIVPTPGAFYMVGICACYWLTDPDELYGFGWITAVDPATGTALYNLSFGGDTYESGVRTAVAAGGTLRCGGWTRLATPQGPYLGWVCDVGVSGMKARPSWAATPAPSPEGARAPRSVVSRVDDGR